MKAVVLRGVGDVAVEEVDPPVAVPGAVVIRVAYAGLCGSDLSMIRSTGASVEPHPLTGASGPQVLGHEFSGTVTQVGAGVENVVAGDRVVVRPIYSCGSCSPCVGGLDHLCRRVGFHGLNAPGGGLAELTMVPASLVHPVPAGMTLASAALVEPLAVARRVADQARLPAAATALVIGAGPIGVAVALNLRAAGVSDVVLSEVSGQRRRVAQQLGFEVVEPSGGGLSAWVDARTGGRGVDAVFECAGVGPALADALACVRARGLVSIVATYKAPPPLDALAVMMKELRLMSSLAYSREDFDATIGLVAEGRLPTDGWVEVVDLEEFESVLEDVVGGTRMKVLFAP